MRIEDTILRNLLFSDEFTRKSLPYLKKDYFSDHTDQFLFEEIQNKLAYFNDSNLNLVTSTIINERSKLEAEFQIINARIYFHRIYLIRYLLYKYI